MNESNQRQNLKQFFPRELSLLLEPGPDPEDPDVVMLVALKQLPRAYEKGFSWMLAQKPGAIKQYGDHSILDLSPEGYLCVTRGTFLYSPSEPALQRVLDRLAVEPEGRVAEMLAELGHTDDGQAVFLQDPLPVGSILSDSGCPQLQASIDVQGADRIVASFWSDCGDAAAAGEYAAWLRSEPPDLFSELPEGIAMDIEAASQGDGVSGTVTLSGFLSLLDETEESGAESGD